jgi:hypothetical protein
MRPKINVLKNGVAVTREMTEEEYAEYQKMLKQAEEQEE